MNRVIKFRAWNPDNENHPMVQNALFRCDARELLNGEGVYKNWTLMQFTGLLDKNGVEIYEGDIVHIKHSFRDREWTGAVVWGDYGFTGDGFYFTHYDIPSDLFSEGTEFIEVIGNIYENPELLKEST